ncbi:MAG: type VI secretion system ATPase TssH, partial [Zetaproteobacteria bacterium]
PYSVVLLDEIEKAHPDVFNILLQVLDDGRLTDSHGRTVSFRNTIIIMTSNIGSQYLLEGVDDQGNIREDARERVFAELKAHFRPEFLNRLDAVVLFKPLTRDEVVRIVDLLTEELKARLAEQEIELELTEAAKRWLAEGGYDPVYGARPLKRFIQRHLETPLARKIIAGEIAPGQKVVVDRAEEGLSIQAQARA